VVRLLTNTKQNVFEFKLHPANGCQDFLVALSNYEAVEWINSWPNWASPAVIFYGSRGCGKSHLANLFRLNSDAVPITPKIIRDCGVSKILEDVRNCFIDDVDSGFNEQNLFHLFNGITSNGGNILMTASIAPSYWGLGLKDLESRLKSIPSIKIGRPDDRLLEAVLAKCFSDRQLLVNADIIKYLLTRMERSLAAAQDMVDKIDQHSLVTGRKITLPLVRQVLSEQFGF